ncbi:hypothetical protein PENTCL1PPCAC_21670, partial [Pristionchus entomophagus]
VLRSPLASLQSSPNLLVHSKPSHLPRLISSTPQEMSITLVSSDEQSFPVDRQILKQSGTIETLIVNMNLDDAEVDASAMPIPLPNVKGAVLGKILEWCETHKDDPLRAADDEDKTEITLPQWDAEFLNRDKIGHSMLLEITVAANYLDIKTLLEYCCKTIANTFKGKSGEDIRKDWGVKNEFTPEEEAAIKKENEWCE